MKKSKTVFRIKNLNIAFGKDGFRLGNIKSLKIQEGDIIGVLGESGCGKSTFGKCLVGLINNRSMARYNINRLDTSRIEVPTLLNIFKGRNVLTGTKKELRKYRKHIQMIFQNPRSSLNLNMPVPAILEESIRINDPDISRQDLERRIKDLTERFEITGEKATAKPKSLSGGERRRLGIAKVFATRPDIIIADEPVASLDVSIRGKILKTLREEWSLRYGLWQDGKIDTPLTIIMISHDFDLIQNFCHKTIVFYGDIHVNRGTVIEVYDNKDRSPDAHPYTRELQAAAEFMRNPMNDDVIMAESTGTRKELLKHGCVYLNKCHYVKRECADQQPVLRTVNGHQVACILFD